MKQTLAAINTAGRQPPTPEDALQHLAISLYGKSAQIRLALACLLAKGHLLIEDVPGVGKTTLAQSLASLFGLDWKRVQFTSDLLPADIVGVSIFNSDLHDFQFKPGPVFTSILLADEINRAPPRAQSALLEAMEERQVTVDGKTHALPDPFFVIATQNAADQLGAFVLPDSQLDRFLVGLSIGYPDPESERQLLRHGDTRHTSQTASAGHDQAANKAGSSPCNPALLQHWIQQASRVTVSEKLLDYAQALILETRQTATQRGTPGLSPRSGLALLNLARAWAFLDNQKAVLPEHLQAIFPAVAGHRLTGSVASGDSIARQILDNVAIP